MDAGGCRSVPRRGQRPDRLARRRLHDHRLLPVLGAAALGRCHQRLVDPAAQRQRGAGLRQLRAQQCQGRGGRLRRHRDLVRMGCLRPDPAGVGEVVPQHGEAGFRHARGPAGPCALPRGHLQGPAVGLLPLPRHRPDLVLLGAGLLVRADGPDPAGGRQAAAAVLPDAADARPGVPGVRSDHDILTCAASDAGGVHERVVGAGAWLWTAAGAAIAA